MPSKNRVKQYIPNSVYHVYNRGVEKRVIFHSADDYKYYLSCLRMYLQPQEATIKDLIARHRSTETLNAKLISLARVPNYAGRVKIFAYALMPNHFHLLLKQSEVDGMTRFMKSLSVKYAMYFNIKNHRVGSLCQDIYKARRIKSKKDLLKTAQYIYRNPLELSQTLETYPWSSLQYWDHKKAPAWIYHGEIQDAFTNSAHYNKHKSLIDYVKDQP